MRADIGTPELGITGVDLASFVPAGRWGDAIVVQEEWSKRSAKQKRAHFRCEEHLLSLQMGATITQTKILFRKKSCRAAQSEGRKTTA